MDLSVGQIRQDDEPIFVVHDISARKRVEQQLVHAQKMEAIGPLSCGIAHDFNNLLTVTPGSAETLHGALEARPDLQDHAAAILRVGQRGAGLTQRVLAFARREELRPPETDCNAPLRSLQPLLRRTLPANIEIRTELAPICGRRSPMPASSTRRSSISPWMRRTRCRKADARPSPRPMPGSTSPMPIRAWRSGPGSMWRSPSPMTDTRCRPRCAPGPSSRSSPPPFFTTEEFGKGSGLGLSMVSGFVKQSNGHVSIYNEPGLGTTVRLYLRAAVESAPQRPAPSARAQGAARFRLCHRNARRTRTRTAGDAAAEHAAPESRLGPARARGARRVAAAG